jgi:hypothetical protein
VSVGNLSKEKWLRRFSPSLFRLCVLLLPFFLSLSLSLCFSSVFSNFEMSCPRRPTSLSLSHFIQSFVAHSHTPYLGSVLPSSIIFSCQLPKKGKTLQTSKILISLLGKKLYIFLLYVSVRPSLPIAASNSHLILFTLL